MTTPSPRMLAPALLSALALAGCGTTTASVTGFKGEERAVAITIANLQTDASAGEEKKICTEDLAETVVTSLGGVSGCETAIKDQLTQVSNLELTVKSVSVEPGASSATAKVEGTVQGKKQISTVSLVKEKGAWRISALQ